MTSNELSIRRARLLTKWLPDKERRQSEADRKRGVLEAFCKTIAERSPSWFGATLVAFALIVSAALGLKLLYRYACDQGWLPEEPTREVSDLRIGEDYRNHPAADWAMVDEKNMVLATRGGGAQRFRLDSGVLGFWPGFWQGFDRERTGGMLATDDLRQVHNDGQRLWFVGEGGSLSSCDLQFHDWRLHFGGGGFVKDLDLAAELSALVISADGSIFAAGTRNHGLGIYDLHTRQWQAFSANQPEENGPGKLNHPHVTALLLHDDRLWVGTERGLNLFRLSRMRGLLRVVPVADSNLPGKFARREVRALSWVEAGDEGSQGGSVECIAGRNAHLETDPRTGQWRVIVGEGDEQLAGLNTAASVPALAPLADGAWLSLSGRGFAFYDPALRQLRLHNEGLPAVGNGITPVTIKSDLQNGVWAVARAAEGQRGLLYRRTQSWLLTADEIKNASAFLEKLRGALNSNGPNGEDRVLQHLSSYFSNGTREKLANRSLPEVEGQELYRSLAEELNEALQSRSLYDPWHFGETDLSEEVLRLIGQPHEGQELQRFNRLLLEDAFPNEKGAPAVGIPKALQWRQISSEKEDVAELEFIGSKPMVRLADGTVRIDPESFGLDAFSARLFQPIHSGPPFGPAEKAADQLFVGVPAKDNSVVARYVPSLRSWQAMVADTTTPFAQMRASENSLWAVKVNGEAGYFAPLVNIAAPEYHPVIGPSALLSSPGKIVTAETFQNSFWFLRQEGENRTLAYSYDPATRAIAAAGNGLDPGTHPLRLRSAGSSLYLWSKAGERGVIHSLKDKDWKQVDHQQANLAQMVMAGDRMLCRGTSGEVFIHKSPESFTTLLHGNGQAQWRRLAPDRFGRVWGLKPNGGVLLYNRSSGAWYMVIPDGEIVNDLAVASIATNVDRVYVATPGGLRVWEATSTDSKEVTQEERKRLGLDKPQSDADSDLFLQTINQFDFDGRYLWALTENRNQTTLAVWRYEVAGGQPERIWTATGGAAAVTADEWAKAVWANFIDGELWAVTDGGKLSRYRLGSRAWASDSLGTNQPRNLQMAKPGVLWWMASGGSLYAGAMVKSDSFLGFGGNYNWQNFPFNGTPAYRSRWEDVVWALGWLIVIALGAAALSVTLPLLGMFVSWIGEVWEWRRESLRFQRGERDSPLGPFPTINQSGDYFPWRRIAAAAVLAALIFLGLGVLIQFVWIEPYQPFLGEHFAGRVREYAVNGDELTVLTNDGKVWVFACNGVDVTPKRYLGWDSRPLSPHRLKDELYDDSERWKLKQSAGQFNLQWKNPGGNFVECRFGPRGLEQDNLNGFVVEGDLLLAQTPVGMVEYRLRSEPELFRFTPLPLVPGALARESGSVYYWSPEGPNYRYDSSAAQPWKQVASTPWPREVGFHGVHWRQTPLGSEFSAADFDSATGRFHADQILDLTVDVANQTWFHTRAGWRRSLTDTALSEPAAAPPQPASPIAEWPATDAWICRRTTTAGGADITNFIFAPSQDQSLTDDPFGTRGRWPDEDVRTVLVDGGNVWLGTAYGVRRRDSSGQETISLPRRKISRLAQVDGAIFCRAGDGDYRLSGGDWKRVNEASAAAFPPQRFLTLPLGVDVSVVAIESIYDNGASTVLSGFDAQRMRLGHDVIWAIAGDSDSFWAITPAGVQHLKTVKNLVNAHRAYFKNFDVAALRKGADGALHVLTGNQSVFRYEDLSGVWQALSSGDRNHPFAAPLRGPLSRIVAWSRQFVKGGDRCELSTSGLALEFIKGQLASDCITSVAGLASQRWQATPAGIIQSNSFHQSPYRQQLIAKSNGAGGSEIAVDQGMLVFKSESVFYGYDVKSSVWRKVRTSSFDLANAVFNGIRWEARPVESDHESDFTGGEWKVRSTDADRPHITFQPAANQQAIICPLEDAGSKFVENEWRTKLNASGQFPFDVVYQVLSRDGELGLALGSGLAFYPADLLRQPSFTPVRYLHAQRCSKWLRQQWTPSLSADDRNRLWLALAHPSQTVTLVSEDNDSFAFRLPRNGEGDNPFDRRPQWSGEVNGTHINLEISESAQLTTPSNKSQAPVVVIPRDRLVGRNEKILGISKAGSNLWVVTSRGLEVVSLTTQR